MGTKLSLYDYCMENSDKKYLIEEWDTVKNDALGIQITEVPYTKC